MKILPAYGQGLFYIQPAQKVTEFQKVEYGHLSFSCKQITEYLQMRVNITLYQTPWRAELQVFLSDSRK